MNSCNERNARGGRTGTLITNPWVVILPFPPEAAHTHNRDSMRHIFCFIVNVPGTGTEGEWQAIISNKPVARVGTSGVEWWPILKQGRSPGTLHI